MWVLREDKGREDVLRTCGKTLEANLLLFSDEHSLVTENFTSSEIQKEKRT